MRRAKWRRTDRGSASASRSARAAMNSGMTMARVLMAALKRSCLDAKCRRMAAGVTPRVPAMSASVVAANPRAVKAERAASRI